MQIVILLAWLVALGAIVLLAGAIIGQVSGQVRAAAAAA